MLNELKSEELMQVDGGIIFEVILGTVTLCGALYGAAYAVGIYQANRDKEKQR